MTQVRTRMAPSPTGEMHVGSMAILLKNYAYAQKHHGSFVLRIEDTDKEREVANGIADILDIIKRFGLEWDEGPEVGGPHGPYIQSQRLEVYTRWAHWLVEHAKAYYCFCSRERLEKVRENQKKEKLPPKYDKHCRKLSATEIETKLRAQQPYVIRLAVPKNQEITFSDLIRGEITFNSTDIDDQVLLKSDGYPTYHLAVVIDDHLMKISHIMRGEEWISSTPKHIMLYQAFGWDIPVYAHIPIFLNPDGKGKMSKRKGTVSARSFLERGYLPEALLNFFMILGWAHPEEKEILTLEEYVDHFDPQDVSAKSVVFDMKKLQWINGVYIRALSPEALRNALLPFLPENFPLEKYDLIIPLIRERLVTLADVAALTTFFYQPISVDLDLLLKKANDPGLVEQLEETEKVLSTMQEWSVSAIEDTIRTLQEDKGWHRGKFFMALRITVTASQATPPLFDTIYVLGKQTVLARIQQVRARLR